MCEDPEVQHTEGFMCYGAFYTFISFSETAITQDLSVHVLITVKSLFKGCIILSSLFSVFSLLSSSKQVSLHKSWQNRRCIEWRFLFWCVWCTSGPDSRGFFLSAHLFSGLKIWRKHSWYCAVLDSFAFSLRNRRDDRPFLTIPLHCSPSVQLSSPDSHHPSPPPLIPPPSLFLSVFLWQQDWCCPSDPTHAEQTAEKMPWGPLLYSF